MLKFFSFACLLCLSLHFISCEKASVEKVDNIVYGTSFGMCIGYCVNNLSINNDEVTFTKSKNGQTPDTKTCTSTISTMDLSAIKGLIDADKVAKLPEIIGCPDCADGGAEWVSITTEGKTHKVIFEYGKAPAELAAAVVKLRELKETFKNCN
ncbi:hypothetical protein WG904_01145 [Pedobacter sp. Du54]|uniref:hypothetical protein n=1 Tax=Pedobacter anseongensis TaxID=3133439 RepID=UPI0030A8EDE1